MHKTEKGVSG